MQCGRVGSRLLSNKRVSESVSEALFFWPTQTLPKGGLHIQRDIASSLSRLARKSRRTRKTRYSDFSGKNGESSKQKYNDTHEYFLYAYS